MQPHRKSPRTAALGTAALLAIAPGCIVGPGYPVGYIGVAAPRLEVIAGTGIFWAADLDDDIFFYNNHWYWCDGPYWYVSTRWGGGWTYLASPPTVFLKIPAQHPVYRVVFRHPGHPQYRVFVRE